MAVNTAAGSKLYIGTPSADQSDLSPLLATYTADTYIEVGEVEDLGEFGDTAGQQTFASLADRRVRKFKTTFDAGTIPVTAGSDPDDDGQAAMVAAFADDLDYNFKVTLNDKLTLMGTPTTLYFKGKVMSKRRMVGKVDNIVRQSFSVGINSEVLEVAAT